MANYLVLFSYQDRDVRLRMGQRVDGQNMNVPSMIQGGAQLLNLDALEPTKRADAERVTAQVMKQMRTQGPQPQPLSAALMTAGVIPTIRVRTDTFDATAGQTQFALSFVPVQVADAELTVNGAEYGLGPDYTVAGNVLTWTEFQFVLTDGMRLIYEYLY